MNPTSSRPTLDSLTNPVIISRSATVALWRVLNALRDGWFLEKRLRHVARMIAGEARAQSLTIEEMLIALKAEWPRLLECRRVPEEADLHMIAERLVSFCSDEYRLAVAPQSGRAAS